MTSRCLLSELTITKTLLSWYHHLSNENITTTTDLPNFLTSWQNYRPILRTDHTTLETLSNAHGFLWPELITPKIHPVKYRHLPKIIISVLYLNPVTLFITLSKLLTFTINWLAHHQSLPIYKQVFIITRNHNSTNWLLTTSSTAPKLPAPLLMQLLSKIFSRQDIAKNSRSNLQSFEFKTVSISYPFNWNPTPKN